ncbi:MAG: type II secretion system F family protein [Candidatus Moranbacteria bacterium]|jgi:type IV pilus assembly protein PilC|nr:type II secretion system F family protein [Candidatus Moranbacteria bacterium]
MAKFAYTAKSAEGESKGGEITAKDEKSAAQQLRSEGFLITSIRPMEEEKKGVDVRFFDRFTTVSLKEKMVFARNLSVMIASGLTVSRAINNLAMQVESKKFKSILRDVFDEIQGGVGLSDSLAKYPRVFDDLFVNMVRVGEIGGNLEEVLGIIATQLEKEHDLRGKVIGALIYPAVILVAMLGIGVLMLTFILPKILGVFADMNVTLPPATRFVIALSGFFTNHYIIVIEISLFLIVGSKMFLQTELGKKTIGFFLIKTPAIKNIAIKVNCARFSRIYSSLLKSGVSSIDGLNIVANTLGNFYYKRAIREGIEEIQKGVALSVVISKNDMIFPVLVSQMMEVGEETGKTDEMLVKIAEFYEEEVNQLTKNLSSIIEPILMILIGSAVGLFAVSMLQPMYSLMDNIK